MLITNISKDFSASIFNVASSKMAAKGCSILLVVPIYQTTQHHIPKGSIFIFTTARTGNLAKIITTSSNVLESPSAQVTVHMYLNKIKKAFMPVNSLQTGWIIK